MNHLMEPAPETISMLDVLNLEKKKDFFMSVLPLYPHIIQYIYLQLSRF